MSNSENKLFRLMNHDSLNSSDARFETYTLAELNEEFGTDYKTVQEAIEDKDNPEYLFDESDMQRWMNEETE